MDQPAAGWLHAGRVGRPHGLDGSFHVRDPVPRLLAVGEEVVIGGSASRIVRRAGDDRRPIIQLEGHANRADVEPLNGQQLLVARLVAPELDADEWWAEDLVGCTVRDADREVGKVVRLLELPSCEVLAVARLIHSVDSIRLFDHLAKSAQKRNHLQRILLEVNVSGEATKDGFQIQELLEAWPHLQTCESLEIDGLMTMAPLEERPEAARPVFRQLRELRDTLRTRSEGRRSLNELSMGMSGDFEAAIEEGATLVRIGSRFGRLDDVRRSLSRVDRRLHRVRLVVHADPGGDSLARLDRDRERGLVRALVLERHHLQIELVAPLGGQRQTDPAAGLNPAHGQLPG